MYWILMTIFDILIVDRYYQAVVLVFVVAAAPYHRILRIFEVFSGSNTFWSFYL